MCERDGVRRFLPVLFLLGTACAETPPPAPEPTPAAVAEELLAVDREYAAASADTELVSGITAMLAPDVIMPAPGGVFLEGVAQVAAALRGAAAAGQSRAEWEPVRAGVSADGQHGFTFGYLRTYGPDSTRHYKYLAYWVKGVDGWRVQAYKRGRGPAVEAVPMAAALPARLEPAGSDTMRLAAHRESLAAAERSFSRDAQSMGLGPAFAQYGSADAVNMGGADGPWVVGAEAIAAAVGGATPSAPSPLSWGPDHRVIVAGSGDLGVTFGFIRQNAPEAAGRPPFAFFTVWRRPDAGAPWRYVAE